jgi:hypothetical protein
MRNLCGQCGVRPVAVNYKKEKRIYYRTTCDHCSKNRSVGVSLWQRAGYVKKLTCDRCGYQSKYSEQFSVFYIDGNPKNCRYTNLKTVCNNCQTLLHKLKIPWKQGDLKPDF